MISLSEAPVGQLRLCRLSKSADARDAVVTAGRPAGRPARRPAAVARGLAVAAVASDPALADGSKLGILFPDATDDALLMWRTVVWTAAGTAAAPLTTLPRSTATPSALHVLRPAGRGTGRARRQTSAPRRLVQGQLIPAGLTSPRRPRTDQAHRDSARTFPGSPCRYGHSRAQHRH